jgi:hypothetical protein
MLDFKDGMFLHIALRCTKASKVLHQPSPRALLNALCAAKEAEERTMSSDLRSPLAKARDEWIESDAGQSCCDDSTRVYGQYLRNRLERAFLAGARYAEKAKEAEERADG